MGSKTVYEYGGTIHILHVLSRGDIVLPVKCGQGKESVGDRQRLDLEAYSVDTTCRGRPL